MRRPPLCLAALASPPLKAWHPPGLLPRFSTRNAWHLQVWQPDGPGVLTAVKPFGWGSSNEGIHEGKTIKCGVPSLNIMMFSGFPSVGQSLCCPGTEHWTGSI